MARPIRIEYEGGFYHVTSWGNAWQDIFADTGDYRTFLTLHAAWLLGLFSPSKDNAREQYAFFVKEGTGSESPLKEARGGLIVGRGEFIEKIQKIIDATESGDACAWSSMPAVFLLRRYSKVRRETKGSILLCAGGDIH